MKIAVIIASRGRPAALIGVIMALWRLRSERHDIEFHLGVDRDDDDNVELVADALKGEFPRYNVVFNMASRAMLGAVQNRLLAQCKDADAVTVLTDRTFCLTPGWDDVIAQGVAKHPTRIMWWASHQDSDATMPIFSQQWLDAADWKISSEMFPFWFDDTALLELDLLIHGTPGVKLPIYFGGQRGKTQRLRDLALWIEVHARLRSQRINQATAMRLKFGQAVPPDQAFEGMLTSFQVNDDHLRSKVEEYEAQFGAVGEPDATYLAAKAKAEKLING